MQGPVALDVPTGNRAERPRAPISERPADTSCDHRVLPHWCNSEEADMHDPTERFGGVDWATDGHAVAVVDPQGRIVGEFGVSHTADGLADLYLRLSKAKVRRVGVEG